MSDYAHQNISDAMDDKERIALTIIKLRRFIVLFGIGLIVYAKLGTPCIRMKYDYVGGENNKRITWARCLTLHGYVEFTDHVPVFFFMKDGRVIFP